jgi:threonine dehydrogenase-like Zn-dependent dehydrogenase
MALDCMRKFGRVALLGCTRSSDFSIDYYRKVHGPGITLIGAHTRARPEKESHGGWWTERDEALAIIKLLETGRLDFDSLIEDVRSPKEHKEVYKRLIEEPTFPILQFDWSDMK